jgi:hypothetical protein
VSNSTWQRAANQRQAMALISPVEVGARFSLLTICTPWICRRWPAQLDDLRGRLTGETRLASLWIKDLWHRLPTYPEAVTGVDVDDAVLAHGVHTPEEFAAYLRRRSLLAP